MPKTYIDFMDQIIRVFPDALIHALNMYEEFITKAVAPGSKQTEAKAAYEYHCACKAILSHITLLLRLAKILGLPDTNLPDQNAQIVLAALMQEAQAEIDRFEDGGDNE